MIETLRRHWPLLLVLGAAIFWLANRRTTSDPIIMPERRPTIVTVDQEGKPIVVEPPPAQTPMFRTRR